jgi:hypothetical protein
MSKEEFKIKKPEQFKYARHNCYDPKNDACELGHSAGTGSPQSKCCPYCKEFENPDRVVVIEGGIVY